MCNQIDASQRECHFKWFNELNNGVNRKWLPALLNKQLHNDFMRKPDVPEVENSDERDTVEERLDETDENEWILDAYRLPVLSWRFTLILRNTFEKNYAEAFQISKELLTKKEVTNASQPQVHVDTFCYVVLANQVNILKEWRSLVDCPVDDDEVVEIGKRMESLISISEESNEGKAFINAMKSHFCRDMLDTQLRIDFAKKATELNPQCAWWHQMLYLALRYHRRATNFTETPSQLEIDSCEKAFELLSIQNAGDISIAAAVLMTRLYGELLITCERGSQEHREISAKAVKFARDALRLRPHSNILKIRLVSLLTSYHIYRRYRMDGYDEAQKLVSECEADVSNGNSEIFHKIGKFYSFQRYRAFNSAKALKWFEQSLLAHPGNFPCFSDMLRNADFRRKSNAEIIQKIDAISSVQPKRAFKCQLVFIKGFFLWASDPEGTLDLWLTAMEESADLNINFAWMATINSCYVTDNNRHQALQMMNNVKLFMSRKELSNSDDQNFIKLKNVVNSVIENLGRFNFHRK